MTPAVKNPDQPRTGSVDSITQLKRDVQNFIAAMDSLEGKPHNEARAEAADIARDYRNLLSNTMECL